MGSDSSTVLHDDWAYLWRHLDGLVVLPHELRPLESPQSARIALHRRRSLHNLHLTKLIIFCNMKGARPEYLGW